MPDDIILYEGDLVQLTWGVTGNTWTCRVHASPEACPLCGGGTVRIEPSSDGWQLFCCRESQLVSTPGELAAARRTLPAGAIGLVCSVKVRLRTLEGPGST